LQGQQNIPEGLLARAERAAEVAAKHAEWAEQQAQLHGDVVTALQAAGIPRLYLPRSLGGYEVDPVTCAKVCATLADGDASAAWFVMVYNAARLMAASWPTEMVEAIWGENPDAMVAASGHTPLTGELDGDTYIVSGRNSFVSGCHHADYVMSPMLVDGEPHMVVVPAGDCRIVDNWDTLGMRGSGSNDVIVEKVQVQAKYVARQTLTPAVANEPNAHYRGTLYRCPSRVVFATYVPAALSLAKRALQELEKLALNKVPYATDSKLGKRSIAQVHYGKALAMYRSVHGYFYAALDEVWQRASAGESFSPRQRADLYLAGTHAMQTSATVVRHVASAAGSSVFDKAQPLEKIVRDMETLRHHGFANESRYGSVAQVHWDVELDYPLLLR
jgi:alkylation response protein AidB-like acyl-CoA dehydrogenase